MNTYFYKEIHHNPPPLKINQLKVVNKYRNTVRILTIRSRVANNLNKSRNSDMNKIFISMNNSFKSCAEIFCVQVKCSNSRETG